MAGWILPNKNISCIPCDFETNTLQSYCVLCRKYAFIFIANHVAATALRAAEVLKLSRNKDFV
jgi:hypothetical protein